MIPEEGQTVERKESLSLWRDIVETCAAFAAAQGGKVFVGVADDVVRGSLSVCTGKYIFGRQFLIQAFQE